MAPAPPLRWLLVKSRSRDGSFGFWSLSLSELSLELSWRGGMVVVAWPAGGRCFCRFVWRAARGASFVLGVLCAGAAMSQEVRAAAPSVAYCVAAQTGAGGQQSAKPVLVRTPHARQKRNFTSHGSPRGLAGAGRRVLNILGGSAPEFCLPAPQGRCA